MPELFFEVKSTVDLSKIQEVVKKCKTRILVGWPSGREHIEAIHEKQDDGSYKGGAGITTKDGQVIESSELARDLHYGTATTPARPFFDDTMAQPEVQKKIAQAFGKQIKKIVEGQKPNWNTVGVIAVGAVQEFVRGDYYKTHAPNSKSWQEIKGSDTPLIDGGDLMNSLTYTVED